MRTHDKKHHRQRGFTLIEIVLAVAIMSILIVVAYSALNALGRSQDELKDQRDLQTVAFSIMNRLAREISLANKTSKTPDPNRKYFMRSEDQTENGFPADSLIFMASGAGQQLSDGFFNPGLIQISYELKADPEDSANPWLSLIREEIPNKQPYEQAARERVTFPLHNRVAGLDFQFFNREKEVWSNNWEDDNNLPDLVQITAYIPSRKDQVMAYSTTVKLAQ